MPIYEYECTACGRIDEIVQKVSDKPLTQCRHCSGGLRKLISQSAFHLKGGGWYADNYSKSSGSSGSKTSNSKASAPATSND